MTEALLRDFIAEALGEEGYIVHTTDSAEGARTTLAAHSVRLLICDLYASGIPSTQFIPELRATTRADVPVLIIVDDQRALAQLKLCDSTCCLPMPFDLDEFLQRVAVLSGLHRQSS